MVVAGIPGEFNSGYKPQLAIKTAIEHAADAIGVEAEIVRVAIDTLESDTSDRLARSDGICPAADVR